MKRSVLLMLCGTAALALSRPAWANLDYWKVVEVSGVCEIADTPTSGWRPAASPLFLKKGSSIRTDKKGSADIVLNHSRESVLHIGENTRLDFLERTPHKLRLEGGSLFALMEAQGDSLEISTPCSEVTLSLGAAAIESGDSGDRIRVFSESAVVQSRTVPEGLKLHVSPQGVAEEAQRMEFGDYNDWQQWLRKNYERNDKARLGGRP